MATVKYYPTQYELRNTRISSGDPIRTTSSGAVQSSVVDGNAATFYTLNTYRNTYSSDFESVKKSYSLLSWPADTHNCTSLSLKVRMSGSLSTSGGDEASSARVDTIVYSNLAPIGISEASYSIDSADQSLTIPEGVYSCAITPQQYGNGFSVVIDTESNPVGIAGYQDGSARTEINIHDIWVEGTYNLEPSFDTVNSNLIPKIYSGSGADPCFGTGYTASVYASVPSGVDTYLVVTTSYNSSGPIQVGSPGSGYSWSGYSIKVLPGDYTSTPYTAAGAIVARMGLSAAAYRMYLVTVPAGSTATTSPYTILSAAYKETPIGASPAVRILNAYATPTKAYKGVENTLKVNATIGNIDWYAPTDLSTYNNMIFTPGEGVKTSPRSTAVSVNPGITLVDYPTTQLRNFTLTCVQDASYTGSSITVPMSFIYPPEERTLTSSSATILLYTKPTVNSFTASTLYPTQNTEITLTGSFPATCTAALTSTRLGTVTIPSITTSGSLKYFTMPYTTGTVVETLTLTVTEPQLGETATKSLFLQVSGAPWMEAYGGGITQSGRFILLSVDSNGDHIYTPTVTGTGTGGTWYTAINGDTPGTLISSFPADFTTWWFGDPPDCIFFKTGDNQANGAYYDIVFTQPSSGAVSNTLRVTIAEGSPGVKSADASSQ